EDLFGQTDQDTLQIAAHNAFHYLGDRYDIEIAPLIFNLAASGDVKPSDMERAKKLIEKEDLTYVGAAVFESLRPPRQLVSQTDLEAYYPLTPFAGVIDEWVEEGWGYADIARKINMPTFALSLNVKTPEESSLGDEWRNFDENMIK